MSQGLAPSTQPAPWDPNAAAAQQAAAPVQPAAPGQEALKSCPNCHEVRSTSQFRAVAGSPDGLAIMCQQCEQVHRPNWRPQSLLSKFHQQLCLA